MTMKREWRIIPQDTRNGPAPVKWVWATYEDEDGERRFTKVGLKCLIDNGDGKRPLEVRVSKRGQWSIKFPPRTESIQRHYSGGMVCQPKNPKGGRTVESVQTFTGVGELRDALVKRCGPQLTQDVIGGMGDMMGAIDD